MHRSSIHCMMYAEHCILYRVSSTSYVEVLSWISHRQLAHLHVRGRHGARQQRRAERSGQLAQPAGRAQQGLVSSAQRATFHIKEFPPILRTLFLPATPKSRSPRRTPPLHPLPPPPPLSLRLSSSPNINLSFGMNQGVTPAPLPSSLAPGHTSTYQSPP